MEFMSVKQVFSAYDGKTNPKTCHFKFCPFCAVKLTLLEKSGKPRPVCPDCEYVQFKNPLPGVVVVIQKDGCVLLGKRKGTYGEGKWGLPQGYIEFEEDFLTAAIREVKEETGLDVEIVSILNVATNLLAPGLHTLAIILKARIVSGEPVAGDDLEEVGWFPMAGPLPELAFEADYKIIKRAKSQEGFVGLPVDPEFASKRLG
jgi:ADP-ribose pyrophosphatase YjhB (NUDIX family)